MNSMTCTHAQCRGNTSIIIQAISCLCIVVGLGLPNTKVLFIMAAPTRVLKEIVIEAGVFLIEQLQDAISSEAFEINGDKTKDTQKGEIPIRLPAYILMTIMINGYYAITIVDHKKRVRCIYHVDRCTTTHSTQLTGTPSDQRTRSLSQFLARAYNQIEA